MRRSLGSSAQSEHGSRVRSMIVYMQSTVQIASIWPFNTLYFPLNALNCTLYCPGRLVYASRYRSRYDNPSAHLHMDVTMADKSDPGTIDGGNREKRESAVPISLFY